MKQGDPNAFALFYEKTFEPMFSEVKRLVERDEQTTLDIVQDAMLKAIRCIKPLDDERSVVAWSRAVAKSTAYDWLRKHARRKEVSYNDELEIPIDESDVKIPDAARIEWIEQQLLQLPVELQNMIAFRYRIGWSLRRIGQAFGLKTGAVDGRIGRAIRILQEKAKREFHD